MPLPKSTGSRANRPRQRIGNFVPTIKLNPSRINDMRAQTGPRLLMRMQIRRRGGASARLFSSTMRPNFRRLAR